MNNLSVALTVELCPVCLAEMDGAIIMNSVLTEKNAKEVEDLNGKVVGYSEHICDKCKEEIGDGIYLIAAKDDDSGEDSIRTGRVVGITKDCFEMCFDMPFPEKQFAYIEENCLTSFLGEDE